MSKVQKHKIKPYARLLTMLGEQLIKNERIALIELIKNSYDADADWVKVTFEGFGDNYQISKNSRIIIEDNGTGMTIDLIKKHWLNPATPEKKNRKEKKAKTEKGRIIQGEKGIGRFSILKLGREIKIITRAKRDKDEHVIEYDFSIYDDEFLSENGKSKDLFLDDINVALSSRKPSRVKSGKFKLGTRIKNKANHGTIIEIGNLKGSWTESKVEFVYRDLTKLKSIFSKKNHSDFEICIYKDGNHKRYDESYVEKLNVLLEDRSVMRIEKGVFDANKLEYRFSINGKKEILKFSDQDIYGQKMFKDWVGAADAFLAERKIECGSFEFGFYIFDFSTDAPIKYKLDKDDKDIIRNHRIYLYRDGIRVYPYGEPDDDWLRIDVYRGTISAGYFLSNDQVVGHVNISQKNNPSLKDKTNREGLIDEGTVTEDFIKIIQIFLRYIRQKPYARYVHGKSSKKDYDIIKTEQVQKSFEALRNSIKGNNKAQKILEKTEKEYNTERNYLARRAENTEDLAGVGLSVETASHDIMGFMSKAFINLDGLLHDLMLKDEVNKEELLKELQSIRGAMGFVEAQLKDIQLLFKSSKQRRKSIRVKEILEKVERIYKRVLDKKDPIKLTIRSNGSPLVAKTTDAVLLQLFLNLFDNSVYWLRQSSTKGKIIEILLDGNKGVMVFSDNGPGIEKDDAPYIFEPFYSGKGEEGRGLGLYIARKLLERNDYNIKLAELKSEKILSGANFVVSFISEDS